LICFIHFYIFINVKLFFFFTEHAVSLWNRVVLARRFLSQRWLLSMTNVLLHPYLPDVRSSSFCFIASYQKYNLSYYFTDELEHFSGRPGRFRAAITHLQSLTTGLCPGTRQFTYFRRLSILIVYLLVSVIIPKSGPTCAQTYCYLDVFFLTLDGFSIIVSC
jgi:hypothetical protein